MPGLPSSTAAMLSHRNASFWSLRATRWEEVCLPTLRTTDRFRPSPSVCRGGLVFMAEGRSSPYGPPRPQRLSGALSPSACSHRIPSPQPGRAEGAEPPEGGLHVIPERLTEPFRAPPPVPEVLDLLLKAPRPGGEPVGPVWSCWPAFFPLRQRWPWLQPLSKTSKRGAR